MDDIKNFLARQGEQSIQGIAEAVGMDRHVVSRKLQVLEERGVTTHRQHGPSTQWSLTDGALAKRLQTDDQLGEELRSMLEGLPGTVSVQDQNKRVQWSTTDGDGHRRRCHLFHRRRTEKCEGCPVDTVIATGERQQFTTSWEDEQRTITLIPITSNNKTTIVEHIG